MRTIISKLRKGRFKIHYGPAEIEADEAFVARLLIEQMEEMFKDHEGEAISFEFSGSMPSRDLANVVYELDCVRKAKRELQRAYEAKVPNRELREAYDRWVTASYTQRLGNLYVALGFDTDEREAA